MEAPRIALALTDHDNPFQQLLARDAEAAAEKAGVELTTVFTGEVFTEHLSALRKLIAGRPRAIVVMALRDQGFARVIREGAASGVHWAFLNPNEEDLDAIRREFPDVCLTMVCADEVAVGRVQGLQVRALLPERRRVLYVQGSPRSLTARQRAAGLVEVTADSGIEVMLAGGEWSRQHAAQTVHDWLRLSAGRGRPFDLVTCQNDDLALGALEALAAEAQKTGRAEIGRIAVSGCDGAPDVGAALVREGRLVATVVLSRMSAPAVEAMARLVLRGDRPAPRIALESTSLPPLDKLKRLV